MQITTILRSGVLAESFATLIQLFTLPQFLIGVASGIVGLIVLFILPHDQSGTARGFGVVLSLVASVAVNIAIESNLYLIVSMFLLAAGGLLVERSRTSSEEWITWTGWLAVGIGMVMVASRTEIVDVGWMWFGVPLLGLVGGWSMMTSPEALPHRIIGPMVAITAFAMWTTVPDTEVAMVLLGVSLAMAVATLPGINARLTGGGAFPLITFLAWSAAVGGAARPASVVGAWACIGMLILGPLAVRWRPGLRLGTWAVLGIHAVIVLVAARVIGLWEAALPAFIAGCGLGALGFLGLLVLTQKEPSSERI